MEYQVLIESVTAIFNGADARNWQTVQDAFAGKVTLDYSSMSGNPAASTTPEAIVTAWKALFPGFTATHHQLGNFTVKQKGNEAFVSCYGTATHFLPNEGRQNFWIVIGTYDFHLVKNGTHWKVDSMVFHFKIQDGNTNLPVLAMEKVKQAATNPSKNNMSTVTKKKITFLSEGLTLTGDLYLPAGFDEKKKYPATIVQGSWITVKEQMADLYAERLAAKGLVALAFDFRYYGESEGEPRNYESPEAKVVDMKQAFTYLLSLPFVDSNKLFGTGICASAQYLARAASEDSRVKKIALIAPWMHNATLVREIYGGEEGVQARIEAGRKAKQQYATTGESLSTIACSDTDPTAAMYGPFTYYLDAGRGAIPEWPNRFALMSWPEWLEFDGIRTGAQLTTPTLLIHSEEGAIPHGAKQFYAQLKSPEKEFLWTKGNQFDFYDQEPNVGFSVEKVVNWFGK